MFSNMACVFLDMRATGDWAQPPEGSGLEKAMVYGDIFDETSRGGCLWLWGVNLRLYLHVQGS